MKAQARGRVATPYVRDLGLRTRDNGTATSTANEVAQATAAKRSLGLTPLTRESEVSSV